MTFVAPQPNQTYHPRVYAAFGFTIDDDSATWVWTNITAYVRPGLGPVTCSGGRNSLAGTADPAQITLTLDNTDGRFTARSPLLRNGQPNPYFPNVVRNTPLKVAITWDGATAEYELLTTFVNGWPIQPNAGVINVSVPITASGRLRRLRRTNKLARSALFRAITIDNNITYDGYWAMEDKTGATQFAATSQATPIQPIPMPGVKRAAIASITAVPGSDAITDFSSGVRGTARPAQVNSSTGHVTDFVFYVGDTPSGSGLVTVVHDLARHERPGVAGGSVRYRWSHSRQSVIYVGHYHVSVRRSAAHVPLDHGHHGWLCHATPGSHRRHYPNQHG